MLFNVLSVCLLVYYRVEIRLKVCDQPGVEDDRCACSLKG